MSNERPDEYLAWRARIGQPDALPEQGLDDREATWQRLNARLGSVLDGEGDAGRHIRRRRIYRYGIAAAFLLLALIPATRLFRGRPLAKEPPPVVIRQQAGSDGGRNLVTRSKPVAPRFLTAGKEKRPGSRVGQRPPERSGSLASRLARVDGAVRMVDAVAPGDPGVLLAVAPTPERKPLRVVSINEIDNPVPANPALTFSRLPVPFRVSLNPRASALHMATAVEEKESPFLKIKLNP